MFCRTLLVFGQLFLKIPTRIHLRKYAEAENRSIFIDPKRWWRTNKKDIIVNSKKLSLLSEFKIKDTRDASLIHPVFTRQCRKINYEFKFKILYKLDKKK